MKNSDEVKSSFTSAALAGKWSDDRVSIDEPYILYITPNQETLKSFIQDLIAEVSSIDYLSVDQYTADTLAVQNLKGQVTIITIRDAHNRCYALRSHTGKRPSVLLGTDLVHSDKGQELLFTQFLPSLSPDKRIIDLGEVYDTRID